MRRIMLPLTVLAVMAGIAVPTHGLGTSDTVTLRSSDFRVQRDIVTDAMLIKAPGRLGAAGVDEALQQDDLPPPR